MIVDTLKIYWRYPGNNETECYIEDLDKVIIATGVAKLYHTDRYNKYIGRKVSFQKALLNIKSKHVRRELWHGLQKESPKTLKYGRINEK